jgi:hypothetical protein
MFVFVLQLLQIFDSLPETRQLKLLQLLYNMLNKHNFYLNDTLSWLEYETRAKPRTYVAE